MNNQPKVSIVIPTWNRRELLARAIASVINQEKYTNWEILVVDNYSSDGTKYYIESLNDHRIKVFQINNGGVIAKSRNIGINNANGKYVAFLDSDDYWYKQKLVSSIDLMENKMYDIVYHDLKYEGAWIKRSTKSRQLNYSTFNDLLINGNIISNSSAIVRLDLLKSVGGISEEPCYVKIEDYELWLRLSKINAKFGYLKKILGTYGASGISSKHTEHDIKCLVKLLKDYEADYNKLKISNKDYLINYMIGKEYYYNKKYELANIFLKKNKFKNSPIIISFKKLIILTLCYLKM